jgi:hypothetical protein
VREVVIDGVRYVSEISLHVVEAELLRERALRLKAESQPTQRQVDYNNGRQRRREGVCITECPYPMGTPGADAWERGWQREHSDICGVNAAPTIESVYGKPIDQITPPEGWQFTGEFRAPNVGEMYLSAMTGAPVEDQCAYAENPPRLILQRRLASTSSEDAGRRRKLDIGWIVQVGATKVTFSGPAAKGMSDCYCTYLNSLGSDKIAEMRQE